MTCTPAALALALLLTLAHCYSADDEVYDQLIAQDLKDLQDVPRRAPHRARRDEEASSVPASPEKCTKKRKIRMCCGDELIEALIDKDKDMKRECYRNVMNLNKEDRPVASYDPFNCDKVNKTKKEWACVMECVGQKKGILDEHGEIRGDVLMDQYKKDVGHEEWFFRMIEVAFPKCMGQAGNATKFVRTKGDGLSCNSAAVRMHHCVWRELQFGCPADKVTDAKSCQKIRDRIKKQGDRSEQPAHDDD